MILFITVPTAKSLQDVEHSGRAQPWMSGNQGKAQAQLNRCHRRADRPVHLAWGIRPSSDLTTGLSSLQKPFGTGSKPLEQRRPTSNQVHHGKMGAAKASMPASGTSCLMARSSTPWKRRRSSSKNGENTTTRRDHTVLWATAHRLRKLSSRWTRNWSCTNIQSGPLNEGRPPQPDRPQHTNLERPSADEGKG